MSNSPLDRPHNPHLGTNARSNFVAPAPKSQVVDVKPTQIIHDDRTDYPIQVAEISKTSSVDRAKGFSIKTHQMGIVFSVFTIIAALFLGANGFLFIAALTVTTYAVVWLVAFVLDVRTSPGSIARKIASGKLSESRRQSMDYSDAYRRAHGLRPLTWWERLLR